MDVSVLVKVYLPEPDSDKAERLLSQALEQGAHLVGPAFFLAEALSIFRKLAHRGIISQPQADMAAKSVLDLPVETVDGREVHERAWRMASDLALPVIYDAVYLAVAELRRVAFWTADRVLYEKVKDRGYPRLLGVDG